MKKQNSLALLAMIVLCLCTTLTKAQTADSLWSEPNEKALALANRLEQEIHLNPKQKEGVYMILLDRSMQWEKFSKSAKGAEKEKYIEKINAKAWKELSKVLTDEQKQQYQQLQTELKQQKEQHKAPQGTHNSIPEPTDEDLELDF